MPSFDKALFAVVSFENRALLNNLFEQVCLCVNVPYRGTPPLVCGVVMGSKYSRCVCRGLKEAPRSLVIR